MGTEKSKGMTLYSLSGHVRARAVRGAARHHPAPAARPQRRHARGREAEVLDAGGSSTPILTDEHLDVPLDYEGVTSAGSMLGTKALQIFDQTTSVVRCVLRWTEFYKHESCGKCTPCREGTWWLVQTLGRLEAGQGREGDIELLLDQCDNILGRSFCALGDGATSPITSAIEFFRDEFEAGMHTPRLGAVPLPGLDGPSRSARMTTTSDTAHGAVEKSDLVNVTIDGIEVAVAKNTLVIRAAEQIGIEIPRFCDHPLLEPVGACRQCLVEIPDAGNGRPIPKPQASCTLPVADGMVVKTQVSSPVADKAQQGIIEFLLINHPLDCPVCDKGGECPLQNQAMTHGQGRVTVHRDQAHLPQADQRLRTGAAGPGALRAVRALHPVLRADRRRPVHRADRAWIACSRSASTRRSRSSPTSRATRSRSARSVL
jgi:hypothetical protein